MHLRKQVAIVSQILMSMHIVWQHKVIEIVIPLRHRIYVIVVYLASKDNIIPSVFR